MPTPQVTVDTYGIHAPSYEEWLSWLHDSYRSLYGDDIYIEPDSQDGQFLAILAQGYYDTGNSAVSVYNDFSPTTAQGAGLSSVIKVNGIQRQVFTYSTAVVTIVGQAGTFIAGGIITDNLSLGTRWSVPLTTIPPDGDVDVTVTSFVPGSVVAGPGTLTQIITPQPGWQTVTNLVAAAVGAPVEVDAALRRRQSQSAALPADTTLNGIYAAVANVVGVQRAAVYQNDTATINAEGIEPHHIIVVVEGGDSSDIAAAIALKKPPGIPMQGNTIVTVVDSRGVPDTIRYYALRNVLMHTLVWLTALPGYASSTGDLIRSSIAWFAELQDIGSDVYLTRVYAPANLTGDAAQTITGYTQSQLDVIAKTFHITKIAQGDMDMVAVGAYAAGIEYIQLGSALDLSAGKIVYIDLDDLSHFQTTVVSIPSLDVIQILPVIPVGRSVLNGAQVYVEGDVAMSIVEASAALVDDIELIVT